MEQGARSSPEAGPSRRLVRKIPTNIWADNRLQKKTEVLLEEGESDWEAIGRPPFNLPNADTDFIQDVVQSPEWQEYRQSQALKGVIEQEINRGSDDSILYLWEQRNRDRFSQDTSTGTTDTILPLETPDSRTSIRPIYHPKPQFPVDTIDLLEIVIDNLTILARETPREPKIQTRFLEAKETLTRAIRILKTIPKPRDHPYPLLEGTFAGYLKKKEFDLRKYIFDVQNLYDPQLVRKVQDLASCIAAQELHQTWLRHKSHVQGQSKLRR